MFPVFFLFLKPRPAISKSFCWNPKWSHLYGQYARKGPGIKTSSVSSALGHTIKLQTWSCPSWVFSDYCLFFVMPLSQRQCSNVCVPLPMPWDRYWLIVDGMLTCWMLGPISPANFTMPFAWYPLSWINVFLATSHHLFPTRSTMFPSEHLGTASAAGCCACRWWQFGRTAEACSRSWTTWSVTSGPTSNGCCKNLRPWGCAVAGWCCLMLFDLFDWWGSHALNHFYKLIWIIYADICRPVRFVCVFSVGGFGLEVPSPWPRSWCSAPFPRLSARHESDCYAG